MPALRIFGAEDHQAVDHHQPEGMLFDRLPIPARKDPRLSAGAIILLAAIVPKGGTWPDFVKIHDSRLIEETGQSSSAISRHLKQLEDAGWIMRVRRRGERKIYLLFDLAGNTRPPSMQSPDPGNAFTRNGERTPHLRVMQSPESGNQDLKERETKILPKGGSPSATSPQGTGSPTTTPTQPEPTQAKIKADEPATWDEATAREWQAIADDPNQPFRKVAAKRLTEYHRIHEQGREGTEEGSPATGLPAKTTRLPGSRDKSPVRDDSSEIDASGQRE